MAGLVSLSKAHYIITDNNFNIDVDTNWLNWKNPVCVCVTMHACYIKICVRSVAVWVFTPSHSLARTAPRLFFCIVSTQIALWGSVCLGCCICRLWKTNWNQPNKFNLFWLGGACSPWTKSLHFRQFQYINGQTNRAINVCFDISFLLMSLNIISRRSPIIRNAHACVRFHQYSRLVSTLSACTWTVTSRRIDAFSVRVAQNHSILFRSIELNYLAREMHSSLIAISFFEACWPHSDAIMDAEWKVKRQRKREREREINARL